MLHNHGLYVIFAMTYRW